MNRIRSVDSISIFDRIFDPQIELPLQGRIILSWDRIFDMQIEILSQNRINISRSNIRFPDWITILRSNYNLEIEYSTCRSN